MKRAECGQLRMWNHSNDKDSIFFVLSIGSFDSDSTLGDVATIIPCSGGIGNGNLTLKMSISYVERNSHILE